MNELIAHYADGYRRITEAISGLSEEELSFKPAPDQWSVKEIVIHLADTEMVAVHRMKRVLSEDTPLLTAFDQDAWANSMRYNERDHKPYLELFRLLRENMLTLLDGVTEQQLARAGVHEKNGKVTLESMIRTFSNHVDGHIRQIERVKAAYRESK